MKRVVLSIGSNLGDRRANIITAVKRIIDKNYKLISISDIYETKPVEVNEHPYYYNVVCVFEIPGRKRDIIKFSKELLEIEEYFGRKRKQNEILPRLIDIDIIFCGDLVIDTDNLKIPHKKFRKRLFVLKPLFDIGWGNFIDPRSKKTIKELLRERDFRGQRVKKIEILKRVAGWKLMPTE
ncbi:MAG: 2-amino-4-hydroxy-6-hydroxymethyldihydropteridine diphosphokinase [Candidatus Hydrogenedentota bacterium]